MSGEIRNVFVSSENRDKDREPHGNSYTLHLTTPIKDISKVELLHASIPNTLFNVTNGVGVIAFSNTASTQGDPLTYFSLDSGFYGATNLSSAITNAVSNVSGITVTYLPYEGKFLFARNTTNGGPFSMYSNSAEMSNLLGFSVANTNTIINSSNVAVETDLDIPLYSDNTVYRGKEFIKSDNVINLNPYEGVFLDIEELRTPFNEDARAITGNTYSGNNMSRSFGLIPMDVPAGGIKRFKKETDYDLSVCYYNPIRKLDRLTIRWTNRDGLPIAFNGLGDNSFLLRFHTLRQNLAV